MADSPVDSILKKFLVVALLIGMFFFAFGGVGAAFGMREEKRQVPVNGAALFGETSEACLFSIFDKPDERAAGERARKYLAYFQGAGQKFNVSPGLLIAIAKNEGGLSADDPHTIVSSSGAIGVVQTLPGTFKEARGEAGSTVGAADRSYGTKRTKGKNAKTNGGGKELPDDPGNAESSIYAGAAYIAKLLDDSTNNLKLAIQSYNAGPGNPGGAVSNYVQSVLGDYQTITACQSANAAKTKTDGGTDAATLCPAKIGEFTCDTSRAMKRGDATRDLTKWITTIIPEYIERRAYTGASAVFQPTWIVLHTTETNGFPEQFADPVTTSEEYRATHSNAPKPGDHQVAVYDTPDENAQFVIQKNGTIVQLLPHNVMARTTGRFNHVSVNIEIVGSASESMAPNDPRVRATVALLRWLKDQTGITDDHIIAHADVGAASRSHTGTAPNRRDVSYAAIYADYNTNDDGSGKPIEYGQGERTDPGSQNMATILTALKQ